MTDHVDGVDASVAAMACRWGTQASLYAIDATRHSYGVGQDIHESAYAIDATALHETA